MKGWVVMLGGVDGVGTLGMSIPVDGGEVSRVMWDVENAPARAERITLKRERDETGVMVVWGEARK